MSNSHELISVNICGKSVSIFEFASKSKKIALGICSLLYSSKPLLSVCGICQEQSIIFILFRFFSNQFESTKDNLSLF